MFGTNEIVGKSFFKTQAKDTLAVTSMFFTLQGEGPFAGLPALFIRLAKCNLACNFCDTYFDQGTTMTFSEIVDKMLSTVEDFFEGKSSPYDNIVLVITGGEPLLQSNLTAFIKEVFMLFSEVQVESNGIPSTEIPEGVTLVCSPKCAEKDGVATKYLAPSKTMLERADCLKFVMSADPASPYSCVPSWAFQWAKDYENRPGSKGPGTIYVSPMNVYNQIPHRAKLLRAQKTSPDAELTFIERSTVDEVISFWEPGLLDLKKNQENHEYTARYCLNNGLRFNMQMHLFASLA